LSRLTITAAAVAGAFVVLLAYGRPPWTCASWTDQEVKGRVEMRLFEKIGRSPSAYAGFERLAFTPNARPYYACQELPHYWMIDVIVKRVGHRDQALTAFVECNGAVEFSLAGEGG